MKKARFTPPLGPSILTPISNDHSLSKVLLVDSLKFNLLAVTQLCDFGYKCSFTKDDVVVTSLDRKDHIYKGFRHEDVYLVDFATKAANLVILA